MNFMKKKITLKCIDIFYNDVIASGQTDIFGTMGLDWQTEATAFVLHNISYATLAKWRYEGWPNTCIICGKKFSVKDDTWRAFRNIRFQGKLKRNVMTHWDCYTQWYNDKEK